MYGWTPLAFSNSIEFGSAFHEVLAHVNMGDAIDAASDRHFSSRKESALASDMERIEVMQSQIEALIDYYVVYWAPRDKNLEWVTREEPFASRTPIILPDDNAITLRGQYDGLVRRGKKLYLYECKTKGRIAEETIQRSLDWDFQTNAYALAFAFDHGMKPPAGVIYDIIRQPQLRQGQQSVAEFAVRIREDVQSRPEFYFVRWETSIAKAQTVAAWQRCFLPILRRLSAWYDRAKELPYSDPWQNPIHYQNYDALVSEYGPCFLFELLTTGSTLSYYRRTDPFPELNGEA
jgi:hypothetical protein